MEALIRLAERQDGLVLRAQADELRIPPRTLQRRINEGLWVAYGDGVLRLRGYPDTRLVRARALVLSRPDALLTGAGALEWESGEDIGWLPQGDLWVMTPQLRGRGIRTVQHPLPSTRKVRGVLIPVHRCVLADLVRLLPEALARDAAHRLLQARSVRPNDLVLEAEKLIRHKGGRQLMEIALDLASGSHAESEARLHRLLEDAGITGWVANYRVDLPEGTYFIDVAFPAARVAVEVDGREHHSGDRAFERDRYRQNQITLSGWLPLRVTWRRLVREPDAVLQEIMRAVGR